MVDPVTLDVNSDLGQQYLEAMHLAGRYAYAGRDWVCGRVASILGASIVEEVHNHHNFAWKEAHGGKDLWVVRKGATPAFPGQKGFVGGSLGDMSVTATGPGSSGLSRPGAGTRGRPGAFWPILSARPNWSGPG
jgi:tRNA-splicing ligase RtcB